jgi:hypothetical protein
MPACYQPASGQPAAMMMSQKHLPAAQRSGSLPRERSLGAAPPIPPMRFAAPSARAAGAARRGAMARQCPARRSLVSGARRGAGRGPRWRWHNG